MLISLRAAVGGLIALALITILCAGDGYAQSEGTFPKDPFNGLQVTYKITGANVTKFEDIPGFTWTRTLTIAGFEGSGDLSISGKLTANSGFYADVKVMVSAGDKTQSKTYDKIEPNKPQTFDVRVPIPKNATAGGVSIVMTGHYNAGTRGVVVRGSWDKRGQTTLPADPDKDKGPQSRVARMKEILKRYKDAMPEGRAATGPDNNKLALFKDGYDEFACGEYQSKILTLLARLQYSSDPKEKALMEGMGTKEGMEGFDYGPIQGYVGPLPFGHQAVVIFPKGTNWKETGIVLDPWPTQKHEGTQITYTAAEWTKLFPGIAPSSYYKDKYCWGTYQNPNSVELKPEVNQWFNNAPPRLKEKWKAIPDPYERHLAVNNAYNHRKEDTTLMAHCPLNVYVVDGRGRVSGFPGGVARTEIPDVVINTFRLADGTYWTELNYPRNTDSKVIFKGTGNGLATVYAGFNMKADPRERRIQRHNLQVASGQEYSLDQKDENAPVRTSSHSADSEPPKPQTIFTNWNISGVTSGPTAPTVFETLYPLRITYVNTYHYHFGRGAHAGTIALRHSDGTLYGPWQAHGVLSSGAPDGTWEVRPNIVIKPGTYTVVDSNPATWSQNPSSGGRGFAEVHGYQVWVNGERGASVTLPDSTMGGGATLLSVSITSTASSVEMGQVVKTQSAVSGGKPPYTYAWFDGTRRSLVTSSFVNWTTKTEGTHVYKVVVTDAAGATTQAQTTVEVTRAGSGGTSGSTPVPSTQGQTNPPPPPSAQGQTNLALQKPATQSSTYSPDFGAGVCVDGNRTSGLCHTNSEANPWWQVDLGGNYALSQIVVYNRTDCCSERERTIRALLSTDGRNWTPIYSHDGSDFQVLRIDAGSRTARYVRLQLAATDYLNLVEVEVYGAGAAQPSPPPPQLLLPPGDIWTGLDTIGSQKWGPIAWRVRSDGRSFDVLSADQRTVSSENCCAIVSISGDKIVISHPYGRYYGTISADRRHITGSFSWAAESSFTRTILGQPLP